MAKINKLTKNILQTYGVEIDKQVIERPLIGRAINLYTIESEKLKINWSNTGNAWLQSAKKDLLEIINEGE